MQMKRRSKEQWQEIIAKQEQSGLSAAQFCRNENIEQKYFSTRKRRMIKESKITSPVFTKIQIKQANRQEFVFEYQHQNSTIKFNQFPNTKWLSELIRSLL